jgi:AcrR family transcriptional regulator
MPMALSAKPDDDRGGVQPQGAHQDQRERLLGAVALVLAEEGYGALSAEKVAKVAGVSPQVFYAGFADEREAVEVAHEVFFARFRERLLAAGSAQEQWPFKVKVAIGVALDYAAAVPAKAQLLTVDVIAADPILRRKSIDARDNLAALLASGRHYAAGASELPSITEQVLIAGLSGAISTRLLHGEAKRLPELAPQLVQFALLPYLGQAEAARVASRPRPGASR